MIYDAELEGYFENGKFFPCIQSNPKNIQMHDIAGINLSFESIPDIVHQNMRDNLPLMPDMLNLDEIGDSNLFSIYKQAYIAIACGIYDAGLILLGQLMEITLKQIILIKTGKMPGKQTFGTALKTAWNANILDYSDYHFLKWFVKTIRNPYTHRNFRDILGNQTVQVWGFPVTPLGEDFNPQVLLSAVEKVIHGIRSGEFQPQYLDPVSDPGIACSVKEQQDRSRALYVIWLVTTKFEQFIGIYLSQKSYGEYKCKYGSPYDKISLLQVFDGENEG